MQNISIYPGAILEVQTTLMHLKPKKIFLVTGKKSFNACGAEDKLKWLMHDYHVVHFNDFDTNPSSTDVEKGVQLFNDEKCDLIISVGGGSPIDMAKLINYYYNINIKAITSSNNINEIFKPVPHICAPTTAGSGSESTHFAVMYIGDEKYSIAHEKLIPDFALIDPELHYSQTSYQKAVSGADALAQAIESFWSVQSTEESRIYSEKALELVWNNLPDVVHKGDKMAHLKLAVGANLAGRAINIAKTTAPHAFSYAITKKFGLPHGHAVAILLTILVKYTMGNMKTDEFHKFIEQTINNSKDLQLLIGNFFNSIGITLNLNKLHINKSDFYNSFNTVNNQRISNHPVAIDIQKLIELSSNLS